MLQGCGQYLGIGAHTAHNTILQIGAQGIQGFFLIVVQDGNLLAGVLIATQRADVGQVLGTSRLAHIGCYFLLDTRDAHLLVVAKRHSPATVEVQQPLSTHRLSHACQEDKT